MRAKDRPHPFVIRAGSHKWHVSFGTVCLLKKLKRWNENLVSEQQQQKRFQLHVADKGRVIRYWVAIGGPIVDVYAVVAHIHKVGVANASHQARDPAHSTS